jgi:hypothetical protein
MDSGPLTSTYSRCKKYVAGGAGVDDDWLAAALFGRFSKKVDYESGVGPQTPQG